MPQPSLLQTIVGGLATDMIACAVAFGAPLNTAQQAALLALVGTATSVAVAAVAYLHGQHARAQAPVKK